jgi:hypothetical protein
MSHHQLRMQVHQRKKCITGICGEREVGDAGFKPLGDILASGSRMQTPSQDISLRCNKEP